MSGQHPLRCVETGSHFAPKTGTVIYAVGDLHYPQVDGVPSVQTRIRSRAELDAQSVAVRGGGRATVLDWLRDWASGQSYDFDNLRRVIDPSASTPFMTDWAGFCGDTSHYFLIRWGCPSYLSNLAFLNRFAGRRIACLGSGVGHFSALLAALRPTARLTILDGNLVHLLVSRAYMAPGDQAVCAELDDPLPLPDATFDMVTMNDAFHYVDAKADLLREVNRVLTPDGEALLLHVHDPRDTGGETMLGAPISPVALADMARETSWNRLVFYAERDVVRGLMEGRSPEDAAVSDPDRLPPGPYAVSLSKAPVRPARPWQLALGRAEMIVNPIYTRFGCNSWQIDWRGSERNRREFGHTPLPDPLEQRMLDGPVTDLFQRGLLVPNPEGRIICPGPE